MEDLFIESELLTANERRRREKQKTICADYDGLSKLHRDVKPSRIMTIIANKHQMSVPGVRRILIQYGLYSKKQ